MEKLNCKYSEECSGCPLIDFSFAAQKEFKIKNLTDFWKTNQLPTEALGNLNYLSIQAGHLRDRTDLTLTNNLLGLYKKDSRDVLDIEDCAQMSPALSEWYKAFRKFKFPIERGSVRLRVGPSGLRGVWLDFANIDIKKLLDEQNLLKELCGIAIVEMGQKRKVVSMKEALKFSDPELHPWFETYINETAIPLYCSIGDFTQPSMKANKILVAELIDLIKSKNIQNAVEFGAGIGNFTIPLAFHSKSVKVYENDSHSIESLEFNIKKNRLTERVKIFSGDYQNLKKARLPQFEACDAVVVDPPRSGLKGFLDPLFEMAPQSKPKSFIYISCFSESFCMDAKKLYDLGYKLNKITIIDQFPQSRMFEIISYFEL